MLGRQYIEKKLSNLLQSPLNTKLCSSVDWEKP